jgi:hypothetical protein
VVERQEARDRKQETGSKRQEKEGRIENKQNVKTRKDKNL